MTLPEHIVRELVKMALQEDVGHGDVTTNACVPADRQATGRVLVKADGVVCGHAVARATFQALAPDVRYEERVPDGAAVTAGTVVATVTGPARAILTGERVALNFMQRMSGIATLTRRLAEQLAGTGARLVDTRKTTPGLRVLEKYAVRVGGGHNHRFGLFDAVLIKDNHIAVAGGIQKAVAACRAAVPHTTKIEVEVTNLDELEEALASGADIVLLDNMDPALLRQAVAQTAGRALLEASGGINEKTLAAVAASGVDLISMGALTHSAPALDISLDV